MGNIKVIKGTSLDTLGNVSRLDKVLQYVKTAGKLIGTLQMRQVRIWWSSLKHEPEFMGQNVYTIETGAGSVGAAVKDDDGFHGVTFNHPGTVHSARTMEALLDIMADVLWPDGKAAEWVMSSKVPAASKPIVAK